MRRFESFHPKTFEERVRLCVNDTLSLLADMRSAVRPWEGRHFGSMQRGFMLQMYRFCVHFHVKVFSCAANERIVLGTEGVDFVEDQ